MKGAGQGVGSGGTVRSCGPPMLFSAVPRSPTPAAVHYVEIEHQQEVWFGGTAKSTS